MYFLDSFMLANDLPTSSDIPTPVNSKLISYFFETLEVYL